MTRRQYLQFAISACWARASAGGPRNPEFAVIVHPSNRFDELSRAKVSFLFLRKVSRWPWGAEVEPIEIASPVKLRRVFAEQVLHTTDEQLSAYWIDERATRGASPPVQMATPAAAKMMVASRPGAVAYIPYEDLDGTIKVLRVTP
jgi:hypothetical protein